MDDDREFVTLRPRYWILSFAFLSSVLGSYTALEMMGRRTSHLGPRNWLWLLSAATSMGYVGMWVPHFITQKAMVIGNDDPKFRMKFSVWYFIVSCTIPISMLNVSFYQFGQRKVSWQRQRTFGILTGLTTALMHFVGQFSVRDYEIVIHPLLTIVSLVIAMFSANLSLLIFFRLREKWRSSWLKRLGCAAIMGFGSTSVHITAFLGSKYYYLPGKPETVVPDLVVTTQIIGGVVACCAVLIAFAVYKNRAKERNKRHAQKVVLGMAIFNAEGQILVSPNGIIPTRKITNEYRQKSLDDEFTVNHPVFQLIYRLTNDWESIDKWVALVQNHLSRIENDSSAKVPYSTLFPELFIANVKALSDLLEVSLEEMGILYDYILNTGLYMNKRNSASSISIASQSSDHRLQAQPPEDLLGKGQMLFLVRRIDAAMEAHLTTLGYSFADLRYVSPIMAVKFGVPEMTMIDRLKDMSSYPNETKTRALLAGSVYVGLFVAQPKVHGLQMLVMRNSRHQIPVARLSTINYVTVQERRYILKNSGATLNHMRNHLDKVFLGNPDYKTNLTQRFDDTRSIASLSSVHSTDLEHFRYDLLQALHQLVHVVGEESLCKKTVLHPEVYKVPIPDAPKKHAQIILFKLMLPSELKVKFEQGRVNFVPYRMFATYQDLLYYCSPVEQTKWRSKLQQELTDKVLRAMKSLHDRDHDSENDDTWTSTERTNNHGIELMVVEEKRIEEEIVVVVSSDVEKSAKTAEKVPTENAEAVLTEYAEKVPTENAARAPGIDRLSEDGGCDEFYETSYVSTENLTDLLKERRDSGSDDEDHKRPSSPLWRFLPRRSTTIQISTWQASKRWYEQVVGGLSRTNMQ